MVADYGAGLLAALSAPQIGTGLSIKWSNCTATYGCGGCGRCVARHEVADAHHSLKGSRAVQKKSNPVRRKTIFAKDFIGTPEQLTAYSKLLFGAARCAGRLVGNKPRCLLVDPRCVLVDNLRQLRTLTEAVK